MDVGVVDKVDAMMVLVIVWSFSSNRNMPIDNLQEAFSPLWCCIELRHDFPWGVGGRQGGMCHLLLKTRRG